ncbi:hypothetical protein MUGA111182_17085 [Mucilaginibacter galii]|uniref:Uncharacterized protein n=1 Tax=Mucilaginibacter galii TaxID=2005073 RepID=A0A917J6Q7_9SPHI|nr:hypothetical protein [Mucilaginibacter galii]GGI49738.1 hypothetical protein GCM10011425_09500 [Mucilaginibacter galii]
MSKHEDIKKEVVQLQQASNKQAAIDTKLDELVKLLAQSDIDSEKVKQIRGTVNDALDKAGTYRHQIDAFKQIDEHDNANRANLLDEFSVLLANHQVDSAMSKKYLQGERVKQVVLAAIGLVLIMLGFAMIIMPAPPYFEMFTIFYFNPQDGVTLMDVISLLIILSGVYLLVKSIYKQLSTDK